MVFPNWYKKEEQTESMIHSSDKKTVIKEKAVRNKMTYNEQRELNQLPKKIEALEAQEIQLQQQLAESDLYKNDPQQAAELAKELKNVSAKLKINYIRWEALELKSKKI